LAEDLGAKYRTIDSDKLLDSLTQTCNNENAGMVVVCSEIVSNIDIKYKIY
jgi:K+-sensing histidine kinase KdpD